MCNYFTYHIKYHSLLYKVLLFFIIFQYFIPDSLLAQNYYFGDLHMHTNFSDGKDEPQVVYDYAKNITKLDFICITDHDCFPFELTPFKWDSLQLLANQNNEEGSFVAFIGYEYTNENLIGHRTVIYPDSTAKLFSAIEFNLSDMISSVHKNRGIVSIAHPNCIPWSSFVTPLTGPQENTIEIISKYHFEYYNNPMACPKQLEGSAVQDWLASGKILGFLGVTDSHDTRPGTYALTGVYADSLTRDKIFNAIKNRHTFATNGRRIKVLLSYDKNIMGDLIITNEPNRVFNYEIQGTDTLTKIEFICNNMVIESVYPNKKEIKGKFYTTDITNHSYYYIRAFQKDGGIVWTSPIYFKKISYLNGGDILNIKILYYPNPFDNKINVYYYQPVDGILNIKIFNVFGHLIHNYSGEFNKAGDYFTELDMQEFTNGVYMICFEVGMFKKIVKLIKINE